MYEPYWQPYWKFVQPQIDSFARALNENPVNYVLVAAIFILFVPILLTLPRPRDPYGHISTSTKAVPSHHSQAYSWMPANYPDVKLWKKFTPKTLEPFNGQNGGPIFFAIRGKVYDVSMGRNFYGPDGPYGNFAGRDASRGLAKQSFDMDMLTALDQPIDTLSDLNKSEWDNLREWETHFKGKYIVCGDFVPEGSL